MRLLSNLNINMKMEEPLAPFTSFKVGGNAKFYAKPATLTDLLYILKYQKRDQIPLHILGGGCNTIFSDKGFEGLVLNMSGFEKKYIQILDTTVHVSAGVPIHHFAMALKEAGLAGLEFLAHLPGTVGGAIQMNAGFGKDDKGRRREISNCLLEIDLLTPEGNFERRKARDIEFSYRHSGLEGCLILSAKFELTRQHPDEIMNIMNKNVEYRRSVQDWNHPSAGSVFKNPLGCDWTVGEMVDRLGLKGTQTGGVQISPIHGNFFINKGDAKASDIMNLVDLVCEKVNQEYGVHLETEIKYVGR
jgi:UDP-N-acetylmuramate dehydrogenase